MIRMQEIQFWYNVKIRGPGAPFHFEMLMGVVRDFEICNASIFLFQSTRHAVKDPTQLIHNADRRGQRKTNHTRSF